MFTECFITTLTAATAAADLVAALVSHLTAEAAEQQDQQDHILALSTICTHTWAPTLSNGIYNSLGNPWQQVHIHLQGRCVLVQQSWVVNASAELGFSTRAGPRGWVCAQGGKGGLIGVDMSSSGTHLCKVQATSQGPGHIGGILHTMP
jgi:hypothetical protein